MKNLRMLLALLVMVSPAGAADFSTRLERHIAQNTQAQSPLDKVTRCLQDRKNCTVLTWPQAAALYNQANQRHTQRQALLTQYDQEKETLQIPKRQPAYVAFNEEYISGALRILRPFRFYFIGESHLPYVSAMARQVIRQLHSTLPKNARVLLATEFITTYAGPDSSVLRRAGQLTPDMNVTSQDQLELFRMADELNMDILSLDDKWMEELHAPNGKMIYPVKVGDYLVEADSNFNEVEQIISRTTSSTNPVMRLLHIRNFLLGSTWGLEQRNAQWTRYLQAVAPNYDAVIVYAGQGHLDPFNTFATAVPQLLGLTAYARIFIHPAQQELPAISIYGDLSEFRWNRLELTQEKYQPLKKLEKELGIFQNEEMYIEIALPPQP